MTKPRLQRWLDAGALRRHRTSRREVADLLGVADRDLVVSYHSDDFAEAEQARQLLAAVGALCAVLRRTAGDAQDHLASVDSELPGR